MRPPEPGSQKPLYVTVTWSTYYNLLRGFGFDRNSQVLTRLGRVGGKGERFYVNDVVGAPCVRKPLSWRGHAPRLEDHAPQVV